MLPADVTAALFASDKGAVGTEAALTETSFEKMAL